MYGAFAERYGFAVRIAPGSRDAETRYPDGRNQMLSWKEYAEHDATGLADLVRRREVAPRELVALAFDAIAAQNPKINAVLHLLRDEAEAAIARGLPEGPFTGVPFLIKEVGLHAAGVPTRMGSRLADGLALPYDTELMTRFRRAGLVTIGTTSTPEFAFNAVTEPVLFGPTRNPWNLSRSPGGSSGGAAAAVAAGIVPLAHANDGGGSIRIPASSCGLFGMKPTRGRVPAGPDVGDHLHGLGVELALTRSVRDAATLLDAVAGPDVGAPGWAERPKRPYAEEIAAPPGRLKIAFTDRFPGSGPVDPEIAAALRRTAGALESLGHIVVEAAPSYDAEPFEKATIQVWAASLVGLVEMLSSVLNRPISTETMETASLAAYEVGKRMTALELSGAFAIFNQVSRGVGAFFEAHDVLLTPGTATFPPAIGALDQNAPGITLESFWRQIVAFSPFTPLFNTTGQPAMSVPLHQSASGLPIGMQFVGRFADEATLFRLAAQLEAAHPWSARRATLGA
ncbi:Aspartyl-tRNA(Asn) amidotransferase subunit A [Minicystis rosea]|nr:Aspartyl-tRNA(Asn) amidotransferase subunit A [Minicystis rosea]